MKYKIVGNEHAVGDFIPTSGRNANIQQHYDLYRLHTEIPDMDVSKFYHGDYYLEELKTIEGK